jgi:hypothetical protein
LQEKLSKILKEEEVKWFQRAKERDIMEGDSNSRYFMLKASCRKRRNKNFRFYHDGKFIEGDQNLLDYATDFYKALFGSVDLLTVTLTVPIPLSLSDEDKEGLVTLFSINEIREVVFSMEHTQAPGPDGFPIEFFQKFWDLIYLDLLTLFQDFFDGKLDIKRFNYGIITLILKG